MPNKLNQYICQDDLLSILEFMPLPYLFKLSIYSTHSIGRSVFFLLLHSLQ